MSCLGKAPTSAVPPRTGTVLGGRREDTEAVRLQGRGWAGQNLGSLGCRSSHAHNGLLGRTSLRLQQLPLGLLGLEEPRCLPPGPELTALVPPVPTVSWCELPGHLADQTTGWGRREGGRSVAVQPAENSHLLLPPTVLGISRLLKTGCTRSADTAMTPGRQEGPRLQTAAAPAGPPSPGQGQQNGARTGQHTTQRILFIGSF